MKHKIFMVLLFCSTIAFAQHGGSLLFPDPLANPEAIILDDLFDTPYNVPLGKTLYITNIQIKDDYNGIITIDNMPIWRAKSNFIAGDAFSYLEAPILVEQFEQLSTIGDTDTRKANHVANDRTINGYLIDRSVDVLTISPGQNGYTVPAGFIYVVLNAYSPTQFESIYIDDKEIYEGFSNRAFGTIGARVAMPLMVDESQNINADNPLTTLNGYLLDKSKIGNDLVDDADNDPTNEKDTIFLNGIAYKNGDDMYQHICDSINAKISRIPISNNNQNPDLSRDGKTSIGTNILAFDSDNDGTVDIEFCEGIENIIITQSTDECGVGTNENSMVRSVEISISENGKIETWDIESAPEHDTKYSTNSFAGFVTQNQTLNSTGFYNGAQSGTIILINQSPCRTMRTFTSGYSNFEVQHEQGGDFTFQVYFSYNGVLPMSLSNSNRKWIQNGRQLYSTSIPLSNVRLAPPNGTITLDVENRILTQRTSNSVYRRDLQRIVFYGSTDHY